MKIKFNEPDRNEKCTCGSGKKYKYCCMNKPFHGPEQERKKGSKKMSPLLMLSMIQAMDDEHDIFRL